MNKKLIIGIAVTLIAVATVTIYACKNQGKQETSVTIGGVLPLTGDAAQWGVPANNGASLAVEEINNNGGVQGQKINFKAEDDQCDANKGISAFEKLFATEKPIAVVGAVCSSVTLAIAPVAEKDKIVLISPASTNPQITNAGDYIFRVIPTDALRGKVFANYVYSLGKTNGAIIYINNDGGKGNEESFKENFEKLGGKILLSEGYPEKTTDLKTLLTKVKNIKPDFLMVVAYPEDALIVLKNGKEINLNLPLFFQTEALDDANLITKAGNTAEGVTYISYAKPENKEASDFATIYKTKYGHEPELYAAEGYDAIKIITKILSENQNVTSEIIKTKLYEIKNYPGASGVFSFDENGDVIKPLAIKEIRSGHSATVIVK